jgi:hypothetical protein
VRTQEFCYFGKGVWRMLRSTSGMPKGMAVSPAPLADQLTVLMTSSPVQSNPSTAMIEHVMASFSNAPGLLECPKLLVLDG